MSIRNSLFNFAALSALLTLTHCGYGLRTSKSETLESQGVHTLFIRPFSNLSFQTGVEHTVYNALTQKLASGVRVKLVSSEREADAILIGSITEAQSSVGGTTPAYELEPQGLITRRPETEILVATSYNAILRCQFQIVKKTNPVWSSSFSRAKTFQANNRLGTLGTTNALVNQSEFERALSDLAYEIADEVKESVLYAF